MLCALCGKASGFLLATFALCGGKSSTTKDTKEPKGHKEIAFISENPRPLFDKTKADTLA
jgi:hypothetical protein